MATIVIISLSVLFQLATAVVALWNIRITGKRVSWLLIVATTILMSIRRIIPLAYYLQDKTYPIHLLNETLGLILSVLFLLGVIGIRKIFIHWAASDRENRDLLMERELLMKEVHHRTKNNIAFLSSLLTIQARTTATPEAAAVLEKAISRVQSIAALYENLLATGEPHSIQAEEYLPRLLDNLGKTLPDHITLESDVAHGDIKSKQLLPLGLIINELVTNCGKYAYPDREEGTVRVSLQREGNRVTLTVFDDGIGLPDGFTPEGTSGLGFQLITALCRQLNAELRFENDKGARFRVSFDAQDS